MLHWSRTAAAAAAALVLPVMVAVVSLHSNHAHAAGTVTVHDTLGDDTSALTSLDSLDSWTFRANWTFEKSVQSALIKPRLVCPYGALSMRVQPHDVHGHDVAPSGPQLLPREQVDTPLRVACVPAPHGAEHTCRVALVWHIQCVLPCTPFCVPPQRLNASWELACHPTLQVCQPRPLLLLLGHSPTPITRRRPQWLTAYLTEPLHHGAGGAVPPGDAVAMGTLLTALVLLLWFRKYWPTYDMFSDDEEEAEEEAVTEADHNDDDDDDDDSEGEEAEQEAAAEGARQAAEEHASATPKPTRVISPPPRLVRVPRLLA